MTDITIALDSQPIVADGLVRVLTGLPGGRGASIAAATTNDAGHLIITLDNGEELDAGELKTGASTDDIMAVVDDALKKAMLNTISVSEVQSLTNEQKNLARSNIGVLSKDDIGDVEHDFSEDFNKSLKGA